MMAQLLGASLEGDYSEADKPGMGQSPFPVVLDELAYYATSGLDRMLAMGRGLNICFMLGFQEIAGIWARLGEKTASLLGNANLTIAMRQQDAGRTREWIEKTAGHTYITQATTYHGAADGAYREARHAEVRPVSRIDWNDLTGLIEGEAVVLFGGRRIYARVFHAALDDAGPKRLGRTVMLRAPDSDAIREDLARIGRIASSIESGSVSLAGEEEASPGLSALVQGFALAARSASGPQACARAALEEIGSVPEDLLTPRPDPASDGTPMTAVTSMLVAASKAPLVGGVAEGSPNEPVDGTLLRGIAAIEGLAGASPASARSAALSILAERDEALRAPAIVEPPSIDAATFRASLAAVIRQLAAPYGPAAGRKAA
jgi:intracellular multiplication protein IcmO